MTTTTRTHPACMVCLKQFRTQGGLAWHVANSDCGHGYDAVGDRPRHPQQNGWDAWAHQGTQAPKITRHTLGHTPREEAQRSAMRDMRRNSQGVQA